MIIGPATSYEVPRTAVDQNALAVPGILHGWAWRETTDLIRSEFELYDGKSGALLVPITLTAGQSTRDWLSGAGIEVQAGVYVHMISGMVRGALWFRPLGTATRHQPLDLNDALSQLVDAAWGR